MKKYTKPLPVIQSWSQKFWEGTKEGKLLIQECQDCGAKIFYPRKTCPECWSSNLGWYEASGKGKIYTYSITMAGVEEKFVSDLPYVLAYIDLEEGVRIMTRIVECDPKKVKIGLDVQVVFEEVTEEITLPFFRLVQ